MPLARIIVDQQNITLWSLQTVDDQNGDNALIIVYAIVTPPQVVEGGIQNLQLSYTSLYFLVFSGTHKLDAGHLQTII